MIAITELLKLLNKPALLNWANKIGLQGISLKDYREKSTKDGTDKHKQIELYLTTGIVFPEYEKLNNCLKGFKILSVEKSFNNGFLAFRTDLLIEGTQKKYVIDFKSSNDIYLEHKLQLSTYKEILQFDYIGIINFNTWKLQILDIDSKKYYELVKRLYQVYELLKETNEYQWFKRK